MCEAGVLQDRFENHRSKVKNVLSLSRAFNGHNPKLALS